MPNLEEMLELWRSRKLFKNFIKCGILYEMGYDVIPVICRNNKAINIPRFVYGRIIRGYYQGFIKIFDCNHNNIRINNLNLLPVPEHRDNYWDLGCCKFAELRHTINEIIIKQVYSDADVRNKVILDIGAYIGDSAIYFMASGARKVYAVEPHPGAFNEMLTNIKLNNLQDKVIPINAAISTKVEYVYIDQINIERTSITYYGIAVNENLHGIKVPAIALNELIAQHNIDTDILKMDCEGCEFDIIMNEFDAVKKFRELVFECHENVGSCSSLMNKLSSIYKCNIRKLGKTNSIIYCN